MKRLCAYLTLALLLGCDSAGDNSLETIFVVESVLVGGYYTPRLWLSRATDLSESYRGYTDNGEGGAQVAVRVVGPQVDALLNYRESPRNIGLYLDTSYHHILPLHRYELTIQTASSSQPITATTVVPDTFTIIGDRFREIVYDSSAHVELRITHGFYPGRARTYYTFHTEAYGPQLENLVPRALAEYDDGEGRSLRGLEFEDSPIFNLDSGDVNGDGTHTVQYPLAYINFYGNNDVCIFAMDDNVYDFMRSENIQQGGTTFAPGEIPNPISHVSGAHGLFGSAVRECIVLNVTEPQ